jgi:predicted alpha/beta-fold hydrolase
VVHCTIYRLFTIPVITFLCRGLDFVPHDSFQNDSGTPIIVVQHGLTGGTRNVEYSVLFIQSVMLGSHEPYVRAVLAPACAPVEKGGLRYRAVVVNFRGCT